MSRAAGQPGAGPGPPWSPGGRSQTLPPRRGVGKAARGAALNREGTSLWLVSCLKERRVLLWDPLGFTCAMEIPGTGAGLCDTAGAAAGSLSLAGTSLCQTWPASDPG